jgi:hypothetical protein
VPALEGSTVTKINLRLKIKDLLLDMADDLEPPDPPI